MLKKDSKTVLRFASSKMFKSCLCKWPIVELVSLFVYINLPPLGHCWVLTILAVHHQAHKKPDKTDFNNHPNVALSGCGDVQIIRLTRMFNSLKTILLTSFFITNMTRFLYLQMSDKSLGVSTSPWSDHFKIVWTLVTDNKCAHMPRILQHVRFLSFTSQLHLQTSECYGKPVSLFQRLFMTSLCVRLLTLPCADVLKRETMHKSTLSNEDKNHGGVSFPHEQCHIPAIVA